MLKKVKSILFVICAVMVFTAQTKGPEDKGQHAPAARQASAPRPAPLARNSQARPQVQSRPQTQVRRQAPQQFVDRQQPTVQNHVSQSFHREQQPYVYATPEAVPVQNNRLFNRQHHNHWQPRYNFYDNQYHFYPYVNIASTVELSADVVAVLYNGQTYFYDQGTFYVQDDGGQYVAVEPPIGIVVNLFVAQAHQIEANGQVFYRYKGVFYVQVAQGYQVIAPVQSDSDAS